MINDYDKLIEEYQEFVDSKISLDMSRGKPCKEQEELILPLLDTVNSNTDFDKFEENVLNYGHPFGVRSAKKLMADLLGVLEGDVLMGGNSSLGLMFDLLAQLFLMPRVSKAWKDLKKVKFICPVPGYDRHFAMLDKLGIEMINVEMAGSGPNMDRVEELVKDEDVKGIICVPKYSNPTGVTFSDDTVKRLAGMFTKADDFVIIWDNAYLIHDLYDEGEELLNILEECEKAGNPDRAFVFTSTSKITFAAGGITAVASSKNNLEYIKARMSVQNLGFDKINQLRHVLYLKDIDNIKRIMKGHAEILRPKFELVMKYLGVLSKEKLIIFTKPKGGYFISIDLCRASAKRVYELCMKAGLSLTKAGATFPYGDDPKDQNIRIAPSYPDLEDLDKACKILVLAIRIASLEKK